MTKRGGAEVLACRLRPFASRRGDLRPPEARRKALMGSSMQDTTVIQKKSVVLDGHEFVLHGRSDDAYFNHVRDNHDPEFLALCRKLVTEDAVCLDIGANIGVKTLHLARHARSGRVIAVEAGQKNVECLSLNVKANNLKNVDVVMRRLVTERLK